MGYFDHYFDGSGGHYFEDLWWDPSTGGGTTPPPSGAGGISKSKILGTIAPKPAIPPWRQIPGPVGHALTDIRKFLADALDRGQNWGNHVEVTFSAANTATSVDSGLGGPVKGYKVVRADAAISVFDATPPVPPDPRTDRGIVWLQANATGTVTLYFY